MIGEGRGGRRWQGRDGRVGALGWVDEIGEISEGDGADAAGVLGVDSQGRCSRRSPRRDCFIADIRFAAEFVPETTDAGTTVRTTLTATRRGKLDWWLIAQTAKDLLKAVVDLAIDVD